MLPSEEDFREWQGHPVTEWIVSLMRKQADKQKAKWAKMAWSGDLDPLLHREAHVRADCYREMPDATYADWRVIHDSED